MLRKILVGLIAGLLCGVISYGQFADCSTGLLQAPTAEMQDDGTFMITNNFLNQHSLATSGWDYNTFQYGIYVSFWKRIEIGYVCTIFNGAWSHKKNQTEYERIMRNQDRHFVGRVCLLMEGEFGKQWIPSLVIGVSDPTTGTGDYEYISTEDIAGTGNGYFNRYYVAISKHFFTPWGMVGAHAGYQFNRRIDYPINAPFAGIKWQIIWLQQKGILDHLDLIAEFDSRTINLGCIASFWKNHFEAMLELQNFRWINFGIRYKLRIKKC